MSLEALPEESDRLVEPVYGPYAYVRSLLAPSVRVLDIGCGNAKVSAYLAQTGATVDGIEPTPSRAAIAASRVRHLSTAPAGADDPELLAEYDVICFFDVLEHLAEPGPVLAWAASRLAPGGRIVASVPNSAHWSFRWKMLRGDWSMSDWGLFDRTHLRFYDPRTMSTLAPPGTLEVRRQYFTPAVGWQRRALSVWPQMFALHVVLDWQRR